MSKPNFALRGSIPAHAGEPSRTRRSALPLRVDPRSRGGAACVSRPASGSGGRSPLTRGSLNGGKSNPLPLRSIPAHAGEPRVMRGKERRDTVDPRSRGGAPYTHLEQLSLKGRSPLTRGSRGDRGSAGPGRGSIPAHAGEPPPLTRPVQPQRVDPRSRGGARLGAPAVSGARGRSPLTRGSLAIHQPRPPLDGSIPAHAGEPVPSTPN